MLSDTNAYMTMRFRNTLQIADDLAQAYRLSRCDATEVAAAYRHAAALVRRLVALDPNWCQSLQCCQGRAAFYLERGLKEHREHKP